MYPTVHSLTIMSSWRCYFDIVDIAMWTMYTRYRVNIVYIDVLSCLHRRHRDVDDVYTISCKHRLHRCTILLTSSTSRWERCIHDIVSTSFTSMYYPVYIVDIAMWTMCTRYLVNIVYIVDIAMWTMYTRYRVNIVYIDTIMLTLLTSSISRCERCIHNIVSTSFTSMYYRVYIVHIVDIVIHQMNGNFGLFCLFVVGRDMLSLSVPQSVNIYHLRGVTTKTQVYASNFA